VWTAIPVPGTSVAGIAEGDSGQVLIAGANGAFRFDGFRMRRLPIFSADGDSLVGKAILKARNGDIWFAHLAGVVRLAPDGAVTRYDATAGARESQRQRGDVPCRDPRRHGLGRHQARRPVEVRRRRTGRP
jgi:hypothetical protein